jgi:hypothetical protein
MPRLARRQHKDGNGQAAFNLRPTGFIDHGPSFKFRRTFFEPVLNARLCVRSRPPEPNLLSMPVTAGLVQAQNASERLKCATFAERICAVTLSKQDSRGRPMAKRRRLRPWRTPPA